MKSVLYNLGAVYLVLLESLRHHKRQGGALVGGDKSCVTRCNHLRTGEREWLIEQLRRYMMFLGGWPRASL